MIYHNKIDFTIFGGDTISKITPFRACIQANQRAEIVLLALAVSFFVFQTALAQEDITPPNILSFDFAPKTVNTSTFSQDIFFTVHLTDDLSGVWHGGLFGDGTPTQAQFVSPSGHQFAGIIFTSEDLTEGTDKDGIYNSTMTLPQYSEQGIWKLNYILLVDDVNNHKLLLGADAIALGFPTEFEIESIGDTSPPDIISFGFSPKTINTSISSQDIFFAVHLTDDLSGVWHGGGLFGGGTPTQAQFVSPSGHQSAGVTFTSEDLTEGTDQDGIYNSTMTLPQYSEQGIWKLNYILLVDDVNNRKWLSEADAIALGFPTEFEIESIGDTSPPDIISFGFSPKAINTSTSSQDIFFEVHLTDDLSGVWHGGLFGGGTPTQALFVSPSGNQFAGVTFTSEDLTEGTDQDGIYNSTMTLPQYSEQGTWKLNYIFLVDDVNNRNWLSEANAIALGFPTKFQVGIDDSAPDTPNAPLGQTSGIAGTSYSYSTSATDPNGDQISYTFDWGDGSNSTTGLFDSGATASAAHIWNSSGVYQVRAMATDSKGASSDWSSELEVTIESGIIPDQIGVFRNGGLYFDANGDGYWSAGDTTGWFGATGDLPVAGDWDGDGKDEIAVFRNGGWYFDANGDGYWSAGDTTGWFGATGDLPAAGDWDGNGKDEIAVFRNGGWYFDANGDGYWTAGDTTGWFGATGDLPAAGDWDGDGKDEIAVFRNGGWYFDANGDGYWSTGDTTGWFGATGDLPAAGDWDGDGKDEIAVFRNGGWYFDANGDRYWSAGDTTGWFGATGDKPVAGRWGSLSSSLTEDKSQLNKQLPGEIHSLDDSVSSLVERTSDRARERIDALDALQDKRMIKLNERKTALEALQEQYKS